MLLKPSHQLIKNRLSGFTLFELLIAMVIIGILTAIAIPQYASMRKRGQVAAAASELRDLRTAFVAYGSANGSLPADVGAGVEPPGMDEFIPTGIFGEETPVGGQYNWDGAPSHDPPGISIDSPTIEAEYLVMLDKMLDNNDLTSGDFLLTDDGHYKLVVSF